MSPHPLPSLPSHPVPLGADLDVAEHNHFMSFEQTALFVLGNLQRSLANLLEAVPTDIRKAIDVGRALGINSQLGWQIHRIATAKNPMAVGMHVPARVSMKKLLTAAARQHVPGEILEAVSDAFDSFERFVETDAGDRHELEAILNSYLPEERYKQEMANREDSFKALSKVKGISYDVDLSASFYYPSDDGVTVERVNLLGCLGVRRSRPDVSISLCLGTFGGDTMPTLTLDNQPCSEHLGGVLRQFSSSPFPTVEVSQVHDLRYYRIIGQDVGLRSAADLVIAERRLRTLPMKWKSGLPSSCGPTATICDPYHYSIQDVFVHRDVYPGVIPDLQVHDTVCGGEVTPYDEHLRGHDLIKSSEVIRPLPSKISGAAMPQVPRYPEMLQYVYDKMNWNPAEFRGYRLSVEYPIYGAQYRMRFRLPDSPPPGTVPLWPTPPESPFKKFH